MVKSPEILTKKQTTTCEDEEPSAASIEVTGDGVEPLIFGGINSNSEQHPQNPEIVNEGYRSFNIENICKLAEKFYPEDFLGDEKIHLQCELQHYGLDVPVLPDLKNLSTLGDLCHGLKLTFALKPKKNAALTLISLSLVPLDHFRVFRLGIQLGLRLGLPIQELFHPVDAFEEDNYCVHMSRYFSNSDDQIDGAYSDVTSYTKWAAQMVVGLDTGVPWIMCKQDDAPDPIPILKSSYNPHDGISRFRQQIILEVLKGNSKNYLEVFIFENKL
ncbi:hypothetical protein POM88_047330 [Heracleum sosnowskyi]|uniref:Beta-galactosidase n=1 Tax=Heracleum sosnowskyi TaxID=360622 RepID=A0AAD8GTP3_9APIA|nr:hypothetical protein POM88_047330 [Heracleum sosnowskyi]